MMRIRMMMRAWLVVLLAMDGVLLGACGGSTPVADTPVATTEPTTEDTSTIDGQALLEARCVDCHDLSRATSARYTQEEWQEIVTRMIEHGAELNADEETALVAYLAETYKP
ncbi:MAG: hypothetical protein ACP5J4_02660 [Anaerolineae bacterium]